MPDPVNTPGAINPAVRPDTIATTICTRGWTRTIRPPWQYTSAVKRRQLRGLGWGPHSMSAFEEDHLIPLELGGAPADQRNLWPEPRHPPDGWASDFKDRLEGVLRRLVCERRLPLATAQAAVAADWRAAYRRWVLGLRKRQLGE